MSVLVGVDVGGTKSVAAASIDGQVSGRQTGPGAAVQPGRVLRSATSIADLVRRVLAETGRASADVLVVGAAGVGRVEERNELARALRSEEMAATVRVTTDGEVALIAAHGASPGILVSAGTGSVALARDPAGEVHSAGGFGWQMGDEGSGYALGRAALGAVSRAKDGRGEPTELSNSLLAATRCSSFDRLVRWAAAAGPGEVAALARSVQELASQGDAVSVNLVEEGADALSALALSLRDRFPGDFSVPVALTGGLLDWESPMRTALTTRLNSSAGITVVDREVSPVDGAIGLAATLATSNDL